jgi:hypothetical protein
VSPHGKWYLERVRIRPDGSFVSIDGDWCGPYCQRLQRLSLLRLVTQ